ncbi:aminotransferase class V-fold PLP-dependent enzyme [Candidatus Palauibacter soopunensis]|uniref:aminotransferase class V-fold PLP-dependent enzyme n=1 Tax=Candidatus Palauibacter soopunensis TaxID=3056739 RepID=UPI002383937D|nr:aminotransferase class V-fold PLP-dependent enzyme [Candidatus Palauibacter soopunensis]MDE2877334.1 aminotransferase class V-fold PLP-dependent enzyme [Candidatus Palauibacter soopunensis]
MNPDVRALFPGASEQPYFDISANSLMAEPVRAAIERHLGGRTSGRGDKTEMVATVNRARSSFGALIGAAADEVAITKNVSDGLNLFGASLPWQAGDNVVLCPALEHPNNIYLWYSLVRTHGIEVRPVAPEDGHVPVEAMAAAMDERTRLVTIPSITFAPGFVTDMKAIAAAARRVGALTLVDAAQSIGAHRTDVNELGVDALAVAAQKALLSVYGFGFLYVRREVAETLTPVHVARFGIELDAHETAYSDDELRFRPGALRFDVGNYNYLGAAATDAALDLLGGWGVARIEAHVRSLAARLVNGLLDLGLPVVGGSPGPHLAHIVSVGESGGGRHYTADDPAMNSLYDHLTAAGIRLAIRTGMLRFSIGVYNDESDIDRVVEAAEAWCARTRYGQAVREDDNGY